MGSKPDQIIVYSCTKLGHEFIEIMIIISSREFSDNQKKYFDLVDQNEQVIVQRGKQKSYMLSRLSEIDRMSTNPELIAKIKKAEKEIAAGNVIQIKDPKNIWESILCPLNLKPEKNFIINLVTKIQPEKLSKSSKNSPNIPKPARALPSN